MKRIIISLLAVLPLVSCIHYWAGPPGPKLSPDGETCIMIVKLENPEYYNHALCLHNRYIDNANLQPFYTNHPDKIFINMENGYKLVYIQEEIHVNPLLSFDKCYGYTYNSLDESFGYTSNLVIGDIAPWEHMDNNHNVIRRIRLLDSAPKFEFYLFTFNNMSDYKNRMPYWLTNRNHDGIEFEFIGSYYDLNKFSKREVEDAYKVYIDVFNEIIRKGELEKYCTLAVKDNEVIVDLPLRSITHYN